MPFVGVGLHVLVALYFAVHVVRTGQNLYWLIVLFSFPLLGSAVYFFAIYLPDSRLQYGARKAVASAVRVLDPTRELREARSAFEYTPTAQNRMRLAAALLETGSADEAALHYEDCLNGPFAGDLDIRLAAARARLEAGAPVRAVEHLEIIRAGNPEFRAEQVALLTAKALGDAGKREAAQAEFESALSRFGSFEVQAEYLIWALAAGEHAVVARLGDEVQRIVARWNRHNKELNKMLLRRLDEAFARAGQRR